MRKSTMRILVALLVLSASVLAAVPGYAFSDEFNRTYPLRAGGSFALQNVNGSVEVSGWDRNEVQVQALKTAKHKREDLDRVTVDVTSQPDAVSVATRYQQRKASRWPSSTASTCRATRSCAWFRRSTATSTFRAWRMPASCGP